MTWGFKEILWDTGVVWVCVLIMFVSWVITRAKIMISYYSKRKKDNNNE